jgi:uncharacterized protein YbjT (DUF2867 family)
MKRDVFLTGGTGYIGARVATELLSRGHRVRSLVRRGSERKLPPGCHGVVGDALDSTSFARSVAPSDTFVQLVGTPHPSPSKAAEFERVDFVSARESAAAARESGIRHLVYVSVAQPAPVMQAYVDVRARGEAVLRETGIPATFLRPWYVLGPGHWWPVALLPAYWIWERMPSKRDMARRLGLVTITQMVRAIVAAVETPPASGVRVVEVPEIRDGVRPPT